MSITFEIVHKCVYTHNANAYEGLSDGKIILHLLAIIFKFRESKNFILLYMKNCSLVWIYPNNFIPLKQWWITSSVMHWKVTRRCPPKCQQQQCHLCQHSHDNSTAFGGAKNQSKFPNSLYFISTRQFHLLLWRPKQRQYNLSTGLYNISHAAEQYI